MTTACTQCGKRTTPDSIHTCSPQVLRDETLPGADKYAGLREALADGATVIAGDFVRELLAERDALMADAERYRWLREQHWNDADMAVVCHPRSSVKLGFDCPSRDRLDTAIDSARSKGKEGSE